MYTHLLFTALAAAWAVSALPQTSSTQDDVVDVSIEISPRAAGVTITTRIPTGVCAATPIPYPSNVNVPAYANGPTFSANQTAGGSASSNSGSTLLPAIHWDFNTTDLQILDPSITGQLYYSEGGTGDPSVQALVAHLDVTFTFPSVVLEHSDYVVNIQCQHGAISVSLSSQDAYQSVQNSWSPAAGFVVVTNAAGCGTSAQGQRSFFQVQDVQFSQSDLSVSISGQEIQLQEAIVDIQLVWGTYTPGTNQTSGSGGIATTIPTSSPTPMSSGTTGGSATSNTVPGCGAPSSTIINGLPAAPCGSDFDQSIDDALGYYSLDENDFAASIQAMAPGVTDFTYSDYIGNATTSRRSLDHTFQKRFHFGSIFKSVVKAVSKTVAVVAKVVAPILPKVVVKAVTAVAHFVVAVVNHSFSPSLHVTLPINVGPPASQIQDSPFGPAYQIYQYMVSDDDPKKSEDAEEIENILDELLPDSNIPEPSVTFYCVGCGINGSVMAAGSVSFSILNGVTAGSVDLGGSLDAGLQIGIDAFAQYDKTLTIGRLVHQGIPGFSIPDVISVGPEVTLDMTADFNIMAEGQLLAGVTMNLDNFAAHLDLFDSSKSTSSGFVPQVHRVFNATGTLTATASLGLPIGLAFGIDLLAGRYALDVALVDTPAIEAVATFSAAYSDIDGSSIGIINGGTCDGVAWQIDLTNGVELDINPLRKYDLFDWTSPPLAGGCIALPTHHQASSTTSSTLSTSSSTSSSILSTTASSRVSSTILSASIHPSISANSTTIRSSPSANSSFYFPTASSHSLVSITPSASFNLSSFTTSSASLLLSNSSSHLNYSTFLQSPTSSTSSSTSSSVTLGPTPCPQANGTVRNDTNGVAYTINCSADLPGNDIETVLTTSFEACMVACDNATGCVAVTWDEGPGYNNCYLKYAVSQVTPLKPGIADSAQRVLAQSVSSAATTTISSSASPVSTNTSPSSTFTPCPQGDGSFYTASDGNTYQLHCNLDYNGSDLRTAENTNNMQSCIELCKTVSGCRAITWVPSRELNCYFKPGAVGQTVESFECDSAVIVGPSPELLDKREDSNSTDLTDSPDPTDITDSAAPTLISTDSDSSYAFPDFAADVVNATLAADNSTSADNSSISSDGTTYLTLTDTTSTVQLSAGADGNLYLSPAGSADSGATFSSYEGLVAADSSDRLFHYYGPEMATYGVSRIRLATQDATPVSALLLSLAPIDYGSDASTPAVYVAVDTAGNSFYLAACMIEGQASKVFLVRDMDAGLGVLAQPGLMYVLTGGVVESCDVVAFGTVVGGIGA